MHDLFVQAVLKRQRDSVRWLIARRKPKSTQVGIGKNAAKSGEAPPPAARIKINIIKFNVLYG
jgi:hypothetical protein